MKQTKPTPHQARMLQILYENPHTDILLFTMNGRVKSATFNNNKETSSVVTAKLLLANGWICPKDPELYETYQYAKFTISQKGIDAICNLEESDFVTPAAELAIYSADEIKEALVNKYIGLNSRENRNLPPRWIFFDELADSTGGRMTRRVDFWVLNCWPSSDFEATTLEIKVYRNDFLSEMKDPAKRQFGLNISNFFYYLTTPDLVSIDEIPEECGLMFYMGGGKFKTIKKAPFRIKKLPSWNFVASLGRRSMGVSEEYFTEEENV